MIAMMLVAEPDLLIADEPTSALDVTVQNEVLRILDDLVRDRGMGLIMISHNLTDGLELLRPRADHVWRPHRRGMRGARTCRCAKHPYTRALVAAHAVARRPARRARNGHARSGVAQ